MKLHNASMIVGVGCLVGLASSSVIAAGPVTRAVGQVTQVWERDDRYKAFHEELSSRFQDVPPLEQFVAGEQWVSVVASTKLTVVDMYKGRLPKDTSVRLGDLVELAVTDPKSARSYGETTLVTKVLCAKERADFNDCATRVEIGAWDAQGNKIQKVRR